MWSRDLVTQKTQGRCEFVIFSEPCIDFFETWKLTRVLLNSIHPIKTSLLEINDLRGTELLKVC